MSAVLLAPMDIIGQILLWSGWLLLWVIAGSVVGLSHMVMAGGKEGLTRAEEYDHRKRWGIVVGALLGVLVGAATSQLYLKLGEQGAESFGNNLVRGVLGGLAGGLLGSSFCLLFWNWLEGPESLVRYTGNNAGVLSLVIEFVGRY